MTTSPQFLRTVLGECWDSGPLLTALALAAVASFESSAWVGGITLPLAGACAVCILVPRLKAEQRRRFGWMLAIAAVLSIIVAVPMLVDQVAVAALHKEAPIRIANFEVLGTLLPEGVRRLLDVPAYWLVLLPVEFPTTFAVGSIALFGLLRRHKLEAERQDAALAFAALLVTSLALPWLLVSTLADNNDLGLRAILPGAMILIVFSAARLPIWFQQGRSVAAWAAFGALLLGWPDAIQITYGNVIGRPEQPGAAFAKTPEMWEAVRRHAGPSERVANNPLFLVQMTPWPVNLSWALLSNRSSCFAGRELTLVYAPLMPDEIAEADQLFRRVFNGVAERNDIRELAIRFSCRVAVLTIEDAAWEHDPFAASKLYRLVETAQDRWRIYRSVLPGEPE